MRRSTALVFVVLGAALAGFVLSSAAVRPQDEDAPTEPSVAAGPQTAALDWRETFGPAGAKLVFEVERLQVLEDGWRVRLALTNDTPIAYEIGDPGRTQNLPFGLMLFETGDASELERRNNGGTLPTTRAATRYEPDLPPILEPGASWRGTISAPGALVAGSWARVVFGTLVAVDEPRGDAGDEFEERVAWITDHSHRLQR